MSDVLCPYRPPYKRIRRPGRDVGNQPLYRADVRNKSSYTATPPVSLLWQLWGDDIYPYVRLFTRTKLFHIEKICRYGKPIRLEQTHI